jgi:hypothetical protein
LVCERVGPGSSSSVGYPDEEAMGGEYMRVLDTSSKTGSRDHEEQATSVIIADASFSCPFVHQTPSALLYKLPTVGLPLH